VTHAPARPALIAAALAMLVAASPARAHSITSFDWNDPVTLQVASGRKLEGRYRGVLGPPQTGFEYAVRYVRWRSDRDPRMAPVSPWRSFSSSGSMAPARRRRPPSSPRASSSAGARSCSPPPTLSGRERSSSSPSGASA